MVFNRGPLEPRNSNMAVARRPWHSLTLTSFMYLGGSPLFDLSFSTSNLYYTLSSLLAFAILSLAYSRVRGLFGLDNENMSLTVKWGRERFVSSLLHLTHP